MEVLLDTHTLLWTLFDDERLPKNIREIIENEENRIFVSTASLWEIAIKHIKKPSSMPYSAKEIYSACVSESVDFNILPIHYFSIFGLEEMLDNPTNNDPFDNLFLATAKEEKMILITHDRKMRDNNFDYVITY